jgi:ribosomal protein L17
MTDEPHINAQKVRGKPFQKGHAGKRPGTRNRATMLAEKIASSDLKEIVEKVVTLAKEGKPDAYNAILARLWPPPKGRLVSFALPPIQTAADAEAAIGAVLAAVAAAKLSADEADKIVSIIERKADVTHMAEVERRLAELEAATKPREISSYRKMAA